MSGIIEIFVYLYRWVKWWYQQTFLFIATVLLLVYQVVSLIVTLLTQLSTGKDSLSDLIETMPTADFPSWLSNGAAVVDFFFPIDFAVQCIAFSFAVLATSVAIRFIKAWVPTMT